MSLDQKQRDHEKPIEYRQLNWELNQCYQGYTVEQYTDNKKIMGLVEGSLDLEAENGSEEVLGRKC